jgi:hypothetical protein
MSDDSQPTDGPCLRLVDRLRGIYTIPVNDGAGPLNGKMTFTPEEPFFVPPIQKEAADEIERLRAALALAEDEARRYAEFYPPSSDSRNTFIMLADRIAEIADGK